MTFNLTIPELNNKTSSKDLTLFILVKNWPLTLKEIYNRAKKDFKYYGSYQSIFKSVKELLSKKILIKKDKSYEINISWIKELQSWTDKVETNYYTENKSKEMFFGKRGEDILILNFSSIFDAEKYLYYFIKDELKRTKNKIIIYNMSNLWKVLFYYRAEYNYYTKLMKRNHKFIFFTSGNSPIEQKAKAFYKKIGITIKNKKDNVIDSIIFSDYYIEMFIPGKLQKKIRKLIEEGRDLELLKTLDEDSTIKIIIHKDKDLSNGLIQKIL